MRKMQAELNFNDGGGYKMARAIERASAESMEFIHHNTPMPRHHRTRVVCLECSQKFATSNAIPVCPGCGGSDVDLA
jgi:Zn finger protein HypA/HybF involved in hydrogenase expression